MIYYINDVTIENEEVLVEYGAAGTATGTYEYGLQRLSVEYVNEAKEYYLYNGTGNVTQTTAENGSAFLRYTYDAFGNVTSIRAPMTVDIDDLNRYTYNGEDYDYNTGLQYLRARYYSTSTGGFISRDTYLGRTISPISQNRYTYAHNNPVMYDDPSGHSIILALVITGAVLAAAGGTTHLVANHYANEAEQAFFEAQQEYETAVFDLNNAAGRINNIYDSALNSMMLGDGVNIPETYVALQSAYADYANAYAKACFSYNEMVEQSDKFNSANVWSKVGFGAGIIGVGLLTIGLAPAVPAGMTAMGYPLLEGTFWANIAISGTMATGTMLSLYGVSDISEVATGYNPMLDIFYAGDHEAYSQDELTFLNFSLLLASLGAYGEYVTVGQNNLPLSPSPSDQSQVRENYEVGKNGEKILYNIVGGGDTQKYYETTYGGRYIDVYSNGVAHESKVGYTSLTEFVKMQVLKDAELLNSEASGVTQVVWHFFRSPTTGKVGASQPLLEFLSEHGIEYVIH